MPIVRCSPSAGRRGSPVGTSPIKDARPRPSRPFCRGIGIEAPQVLSVSGTDVLTKNGVARSAWPPSSSSCPQALLALDNLGREADISLAAWTFIVVEQNRLAERGCLRHAHVAWDHGFVDLRTKESAHLCGHFLGKGGACIVHGEHD